MNLWAVAVYTVASVYRHVIGYKKYCQICKIHPVTAKQKDMDTCTKATANGKTLESKDGVPISSCSSHHRKVAPLSAHRSQFKDSEDR